MTINEIAKMAGVSRATVSRYLNDGYVSKEKSERIKQVIDETGYTPSVSAKLLRSHRTNLIGVIIPKISSDSISRMISGISEILSKEDMQLMLACTQNDENEELKYLKTFNDNHVDGIILLGTIFTAAHKKLLKEMPTPVVILSQKLEGYSCIYSDDYHAAYSLGSHLAKTSKKVGMLMVSERDIAVGVNRRNGLLDSLKKGGVKVDPSCIRTTGFTMKSGYEQTEILLKEHPEIDTLICATDTIASGAIKCLHDKKISIPKQIQVTGFGDSSVSSAISPALTTVRFYYEEAGREAASILLKRIDGKEKSVIKEMQLAYDTVIRESTRV
ncbi:MAG: LacI family DNA-binding transcriptional regulator [Lachnospiraceae bacterium]|nr:LacI family DNA-binding transcriptional regulator [Lachnospiraceae bacterium]